MRKSELALKYFGEECNCSQAVLAVFCEELGLKKDLALKITKGFGGGAYCGELCGAVSAGIMTIGLKYGDDPKSYIDKLENEIRNRYGSIRCQDILGYDKNDGETILEKSIRLKICPNIVEDTVIIVEKMINDEI